MTTINDIPLSCVCKSCKQPYRDFLRLKILKLDLKLLFEILCCLSYNAIISELIIVNIVTSVYSVFSLKVLNQCTVTFLS